MAKLLILVLIHIIGDFFLQGRKMSSDKSSKLVALFQHVGIYTLTLIILSPLWLGLTILEGLSFSILNGLLHLIVDYGTSKMKIKFWNVNEERYITYVGLDQILHIIILIATFLTLFPDILTRPTIFG